LKYPVTRAPSVEVDVQIACSASDVPSAGEIASWVRHAVVASRKRLAAANEVSVRVVDSAEIQSLNSDYRGQDKATNVLSFPAGRVTGLPADAVRTLGDIVVCAEVVSGEAASLAKPARDHWAHMLVHGTLHLLGFDHVMDKDATEMERLETRILAEMNVAAPYANNFEGTDKLVQDR
jgi:probable rRNA maturation factor